MIISKPKSKNLFTLNPIPALKTKKKKVNGEYVNETFYLINFLDIKKNTYIISSFGRVFSLKTKEELPVSVIKDTNYTSVYLENEEGKKKKYPVGKLVAYAFVPHTGTDIKLNRDIVHFINWKSEDIYVWNIEWRTRSEVRSMANIHKNKPSKEKLEKIAVKLIKAGIPVLDILEITEFGLSKEEVLKIRKHCKK